MNVIKLIIPSVQVTNSHAGEYTCTPYNQHGTAGTSGIMQVNRINLCTLYSVHPHLMYTVQAARYCQYIRHYADKQKWTCVHCTLYSVHPHLMYTLQAARYSRYIRLLTGKQYNLVYTIHRKISTVQSVNQMHYWYTLYIWFSFFV